MLNSDDTTSSSSSSSSDDDDMKFEKVVLHRKALPSEGLGSSRRVVVYLVYDVCRSLRVVYEYVNKVYTREQCIAYGMHDVDTDVVSSGCFNLEKKKTDPFECVFLCSSQLDGWRRSNHDADGGCSAAGGKTHKVVPVYNLLPRRKRRTKSSDARSDSTASQAICSKKNRIKNDLHLDPRYIAKISEPYLGEPERFQYQLEFYLHKCAAKLEIAPRVIALVLESSTEEQQSLLLMERWLPMSVYLLTYLPAGMALSYSSSLEIMNNIQKMHRAGILHCDLYLRNVVTRKLPLHFGSDWSVDDDQRYGIREFGIIDYGCAFVLPKGKSISDPYLRAIDYVSIFYGAWCDAKKSTTDHIPELATFKDYLNIPAHVWEEVFAWRVHHGGKAQHTSESPAHYDHMYMYILKYYLNHHQEFFFELFPSPAHFCYRCAWIYKLDHDRQDKFFSCVANIYDAAASAGSGE